MAEMTTAEALDALRPLITQKRALEHLEGLLGAAHRIAGDLPAMQAQMEAARAEAIQVKTAAAETVEREKQRAQQATKRANEAIAAAQAKIETAEREAAERVSHAEQTTAARLAELAEHVKAGEAALVAVQRTITEAEAKLEAVRALRDQALRALAD